MLYPIIMNEALQTPIFMMNIPTSFSTMLETMYGWKNTTIRKLS
jgi:hypothetical protein